MKKWVYLSVMFKDVDRNMVVLAEDAARQNPDGRFRELIRYLKAVVDRLTPGLVNRYFYLFESNPHLFLALEVNDREKIKEVTQKVQAIITPGFIQSAKIDATVDVGDPDAAIDFFCAGTKFSFFRISEEYKSAYENNGIAKMVHCFCNQMYITHPSEFMFYVKRLQDYGIPIRADYKEGKMNVALGDKKVQAA